MTGALMPTRFYIAEVTGTGRRGDPYRPVCAGAVRNFAAAIPTDASGTPITNTCLVKITDDDQSQLPKGVTEIPQADEFVAEALIREEARKAGQRVERPEFLVATARIVDQVKELGGEFAGYELKQLEEMLGVDQKGGQG